MRLALDIFHFKCNSCDGVDNLKYETEAYGEELGFGRSLVIIGIPIFIMALGFYEISMGKG